MVNRFPRRKAPTTLIKKALIHGYHLVFELVYLGFQASELIEMLDKTATSLTLGIYEVVKYFPHYQLDCLLFWNPVSVAVSPPLRWFRIVGFSLSWTGFWNSHLNCNKARLPYKTWVEVPYMLLIFHLLEREYSSVISFSMVLQGLCWSKTKNFCQLWVYPWLQC